MKTTLLLSFFTFLLVACSSSEEKRVLKVEHKKMYNELSKVQANKILKLEVKGMSCEHACGGAIRVALKETEAVERVSFDFKDDRESNTAIIRYDDAKISKAKIVAIVEKLNKGQFTTGKNEEEVIESHNIKSSTTSSTKKKCEQSFTQVKWVEMPDLFGFLRRLI